jgi:hypothetical protein
VRNSAQKAMESDSSSTPPAFHPPPVSPSGTPHQSSQDLQRKRTKDIQIDHDVDFSELLLSPPILKGLSEAGYLYIEEEKAEGGREGVEWKARKTDFSNKFWK